MEAFLAGDATGDLIVDQDDVDLINELSVTRLGEPLYNAAAGYFNAGQNEKALILAQKASLHDSFKIKAEDIIKRIKKLNKE